MILSLQVPAHEVIAAVNSYCEDNELKCRYISGHLKMNTAQKRIGEK